MPIYLEFEQKIQELDEQLAKLKEVEKDGEVDASEPVKALEKKILDTKNQSSLADYFILATCSNSIQASSCCEELIVQAKAKGFTSLSVEGKYLDSDWILIDLGEVIVHLFNGTSREIYALDEHWSESTIVEIPEELYFPRNDNGLAVSSTGPSQKDEDDLDYF